MRILLLVACLISTTSFAQSRVMGIVGDTACSTGLSSQEQRTAVVRGQVVQGMSLKEVLRIHGEPDIERLVNGRKEWTWDATDRKPYRAVNFDENECASFVYESLDTSKTRRER